MNRKILYTTIFISIFFFSTTFMVQPVHGYELGVTEEAIGTSIEREIKIYDEDEWEDHLGGGSNPKDLRKGDVDVIGAKDRQYLYELEIGEHQVEFEEDFLYRDLLLDDEIPEAYIIINSLADVNIPTPGPYGPLGAFALGAAELIAAGIPLQSTGANNTAAAVYADIQTSVNIMNASLAYPGTSAPHFNLQEFIFGDEYDGAIILKDHWDFSEEPLDASNPDLHNDKIPFLGDPHDWRNVLANMRFLTYDFEASIDMILNPWYSFYLNYSDSLYDTSLLPGGGPNTPGLSADALTAYQAFNDSIEQYLLDLLTMGNISWTEWHTISTSINITNVLVIGDNTIFNATSADRVAGFFGLIEQLLCSVKESILALIPDKFGLLLRLLEEEMPCYVPQDDYMSKVVELYNLKEDTLYRIPFIDYGKDMDGNGMITGIELGSKAPMSGLPLLGSQLGGDTIYIYAEVEVEVADGVLTVEINYQKDQLDPKDDPRMGGNGKDELEDWEWVFTFGDTGTQDVIQIKDGDLVFYEIGIVDQIPGFEITVILCASAVSIIGLIYIVMKKRKK